MSHGFDEESEFEGYNFTERYVMTVMEEKEVEKGGLIFSNTETEIEFSKASTEEIDEFIEEVVRGLEERLGGKDGFEELVEREKTYGENIDGCNAQTYNGEAVIDVKRYTQKAPFKPENKQIQKKHSNIVQVEVDYHPQERDDEKSKEIKEFLKGLKKSKDYIADRPGPAPKD